MKRIRRSNCVHAVRVVFSDRPPEPERMLMKKCPRCKEEHEDKTQSCRSCLDLLADKKAERLLQREAAGLCTRCGKEPPTDGEYKWCDDCREIKSEKNRRIRERIKQEVKEAYGNKCACCGEDEPIFLTLDHKNNDGGGRNRDVTGYGFYLRVRKDGYPDHLQLLCWNCNTGRHINGGVCPHVS